MTLATSMPSCTSLPVPTNAGSAIGNGCALPLLTSMLSSALAGALVRQTADQRQQRRDGTGKREKNPASHAHHDLSRHPVPMTLGSKVICTCFQSSYFSGGQRIGRAGQDRTNRALRRGLLVPAGRGLDDLRRGTDGAIGVERDDHDDTHLGGVAPPWRRRPAGRDPRPQRIDFACGHVRIHGGRGDERIERGGIGLRLRRRGGRRDRLGQRLWLRLVEHRRNRVDRPGLAAGGFGAAWGLGGATADGSAATTAGAGVATTGLGAGAGVGTGFTAGCGSALATVVGAGAGVGAGCGSALAIGGGADGAGLGSGGTTGWATGTGAGGTTGDAALGAAVTLSMVTRSIGTGSAVLASSGFGASEKTPHAISAAWAITETVTPARMRAQPSLSFSATSARWLKPAPLIVPITCMMVP